MDRYREKKEAVRKLFEWEEANNIPKDERLTYDPFDSSGSDPRKKAYVDIRVVEGKVENLKELGKLK